MKSFKRGSIVLVLALLGSFFVVAMGLVFHESGERESVKQMLGHRTAEMAALSGIDWAESKLRHNRWYMPSDVDFKYKIVKGLPTFGKVDKILPDDGGKFTVVCQDVASKKPLKGVMGMQELWLLNHIDVFSLGQYKNKKCLFYARYIISPEPALNSNSTDGIKYSAKVLNPFGMNVTIPKSTISNKPVKKFKIQKILAHKKQSVDINTIVAEVTPEDPKSSKVFQIRPSGIGKITDIFFKVGDTCSPGDSLLEIAKDPLGKTGVKPNVKTLKKMVRLTRIDLKLFPNFDINSLEDRDSVASYINNTADAFLINFVAHLPLVNHLEKLNAKSVPEKLKYDEILKNFPTSVTTTTRNRAENSFISYMMKNFVSPGCSVEKKEEAKKESYLQLDHKKTKPPKKLLKKLEEINMKWVLKSKPRNNSEYYAPKFYKDQFLKLLTPDTEVNTDEFVKQLSGLDDASRMINIQEGPFKKASSNETKDSIVVVDPDAKPNPVKVSVKKIRKKYIYVDPVNNFTIEIEDLVGFIKKYYSSDSSILPKEEKRTISQIDWPLPKPQSAPPKVSPGMKAVWHPGKAGTPPNKTKHEKWVKVGGKERKIPYPTGGARDFEDPNKYSSPGIKTYKVPIAKKSEDDSNSNPPLDVGPKSDNNSNVNPPADFGNGDETKGSPGTNGSPGDEPPDPKSNIFATHHIPLKLNDGGTWKGTPGSPGTPPTEGKWSVETIPPPPTSSSNANSHICSCCFAAGTKILMKNKVEKNIEDVKVGDEILSYNLKSQKISNAVVKGLEKPIRNHITKLKFSSGATLKLTNEHPLYTKKGWASLDPDATLRGHKMHVKMLRVGDFVKTIKNVWLKLLSINTVLKQTQVYNLSKIEPYNTYFANNILVHNKGGSQANNQDPPGGNQGQAGVNGAKGNAGSNPTGSGGNANTGGGPGGANGNGTNNGGNTGGGSNGSNPNGSSGNQIGGGGPGGANGNGTNSGGNSGGGAGGNGTNGSSNSNGSSSNGTGGSSSGSYGSNSNPSNNSSSGNGGNSSSSYPSGGNNNAGYGGSSYGGSSGYSSSGGSGGGGTSYSSYSGGV